MSLKSVSPPETDRNPATPFAEFDQWVRSALNHLYDVPYLQAHPLTRIMITHNNRIGRSQQLREVLLGAIDAMRPQAGVQQGSAIWRGFRILELRYIEGLTPTATMAELAISRSQFYKEQARMVDAVVDLLWQRHGAESAGAAVEPFVESLLDSVVSSAGEPPHDQPVTRQEAAHTEMARLREQSRPKTVDLGEVLLNLQPLLASLTKVRNIEIRYKLDHELWVDHADRVMARQAILSVLTYALDQSPYGHVEVRSLRDEAWAGFAVRAIKAPADQAPCDLPLREGVGLAVAQELMAAMHGRLDVAEASHGEWHAQLLWQPAESAVVFVVDDNEAFVRLVSRYLASCHCRVVGVTSVAQARAYLAVNPVDVILSDVMMPDEDGWEFLAFAKSSPQSAGVPFVVCSVLREPQLAMALGAAAYLTKPLTPEALLAALARWIELPSNLAPAHPA